MDKVTGSRYLVRGRVIFLVALGLLAVDGCSREPDGLSSETTSAGVDAVSLLNSLDPCAAVLAAHRGESSVDQEIAGLQSQAQQTEDLQPLLERLGWLFVSKARLSYSPSYYQLAELCVRCLESKGMSGPESLLLRGHAMQNLHRFREAETVARELVEIRGLSQDYGLLGDALLEQGRLREAAQSYQKMVDLKPDPHGYIRAAHVRWLKGDLPGAIEIMGMAAGAGNPDASAWAYSRLALYHLQAGAMGEALRACDMAVTFREDYAPALLARGRILLAKDEVDKAIEALSRAAKLNPLPEYQWPLAEALRSAGQADKAEVVEKQLKQRGAGHDPRTLSLYLSTRGENPQTAMRLARAELETREDVFTLDALAWSLRAAGRMKEARSTMERALAEGTEDARLFLHAGLIARAAGEDGEAMKWLRKARSIAQMLLPSERQQLASAEGSAAMTGDLQR